MNLTRLDNLAIKWLRGIQAQGDKESAQTAIELLTASPRQVSIISLRRLPYLLWHATALRVLEAFLKARLWWLENVMPKFAPIVIAWKRVSCRLTR